MNLAVFGETHVEDADRLVCRSSGEEDIVLGMESQAVDGIVTGLDSHSWLGVGVLAQVQKAECVVVGYSAEEVFAMLRVPLNIVDGG